ncbi:MAG: hypothetical protein B7Y39_00465 [Bdellovibrio sp. 28-41-41]|nr:MAG: hypothetical protein B7Y39_00465 [Bdellovibrio sp. 28-41-41]
MVESKFLSSSRLNQKGQGMIEYILLLFITVTMILLAMANLFKPMQNFLQNFMGTYVACLLTSGELPAIRVENTMKDTDAKCSFSMTGGNGTVNNGGQGSTGGTSTNGSNGTNGNGGTKGSESDSAKGNNPNGSGSGDGSSVNGGGNSYAGSRSRRAGFGKSTFLKRSSDGGSGNADSDSAGGGTRYVNNLDKNKDDRFYRTRQKTSQLSNRNGRGVYITGMTDAEEKKIERKIQSSPRSVPKSSEEFSVPGRKSIVKPPPETKKKVLAQDEESFSLGNLFKYALIAIVLLLILILGGGQAFEMSKTME